MTVADHERTIEVNNQFYVDLLTILRPTERWNSPKTGQLVLWAFDFSSGENTALYFVTKDRTLSGIIEGDVK